VVVSAGTFNVRTATCGGGCNICHGIKNVTIAGAGAMPVGATNQFTMTITYSDGSTSNNVAAASWSSSAPSIAQLGGWPSLNGWKRFWVPMEQLQTRAKLGA